MSAGPSSHDAGPAGRIAAAIAAGRLGVVEGERLLGFLGLVDVVDDVTCWSRATYFRRLAQARRLGLDVS